MWIPPETRDPIVYHHPTRKSVGYFAAVRLRDGKLLFRRETGRFNRETFWEFLKIFRETSFETAAELSPSATMPNIIVPSYIWIGATACLALRPGLPATLQPGTESHRARLETDAPVVSPQSVLWIP